MATPVDLPSVTLTAPTSSEVPVDLHPSLSKVTLQTIFFTVSVICLLLSLYGLYRYTHAVRKRWHIAYYIPVWLTFVVSLIPVPVLIVDMDCSAYPTSPLPGLIYFWHIVFWSTQILCWLWLPMAQSYDEDGNFGPRARFLSSCRINLILYLVMGGVVGALMVFVAIQKGNVTPMAFLSLCIAAANSFGLLLVAVFLGYALVEFPRSLLWRSSVRRELLRKQFDAAALHDTLECLQIQWCDEAASAHELESHLRAAARTAQPGDKDTPVCAAIKDILAFVSATEEQSEAVKGVTCAPRIKHVSPNIAALVDLNTRLRTTARLLEQADFRWRRNCRHAFLLEDVLATKARAAWGQPRITTNVRLPRSSVGAFIEWMWWLKLRWIVLKVAAVSLILLSLVIFTSELIVPFMPRWSPVAIIVRLSFKLIGTATPATTIILGYTALLAGWGIFRLPLASSYLPVPAYTPPASFCFLGTIFCRVIMPMCNNFLLISHVGVHNTIDGLAPTSFSQQFGALSTAGFLGPWFSRIFLPLLLSVVVLLNVFNLPSRLAATVGVERFVLMPDPPADAGEDCPDSPEYRRVQDGRRVLHHARVAAQRALEASNVGGAAIRNPQARMAAALNGKTDEDDSLSFI